MPSFVIDHDFTCTPQKKIDDDEARSGGDAAIVADDHERRDRPINGANLAGLFRGPASDYHGNAGAGGAVVTAYSGSQTNCAQQSIEIHSWGVPSCFDSVQLPWLLLALAVLVATSRGDDRPAPSSPVPAGDATRVYGEWRIRVKPDKGPDYNRLIEQSGLPLFREAGGRMVGWWNTLIGDLYEHVTIWEYDDMAAFERAIGFLSKNPAFARFVAARDPLLAGEESRFLRLAAGATRPSLARAGPVCRSRDPPCPACAQGSLSGVYDQAWPRRPQGQRLPPGRPLGCRRGPMVRDHLSLPVRQPGRARAAHGQVLADRGGPDIRHQGRRVRRGDHDSPADPGAVLAQATRPTRPRQSRRRRLPCLIGSRSRPGFMRPALPTAIGPPTVAGSRWRRETLLIDLPRGMPVPDFLALVAATTGKPARTLVLTNIQDGDITIIQSLIEKGVTRVLTSPAMRTRLLAAPRAVDPSNLHALADRTPIGDAAVSVDFLPFDQIAASAGAAVWVAGPGGALCRSVGRAWPACRAGRQRHGGVGRDLAPAGGLAPARVVPGFGSWGGPELLTRQRRFLTELRRQVGYHICQGRPHAGLRDQVRLPADCFAWTPYGDPTRRRYRARLPGADRPDRPVPRPHAGRVGFTAACARLDRRPAPRARPSSRRACDRSSRPPASSPTSRWT